MAGGRRKDGPTLDLARIVEAAWALVDRSGVAALSTRALAAALDVQGPALYWHVRNKQELLSLMVEHVLRDSIGTPPDGLDWPDWLRFVGHAQRRALLAHRDSAVIASSTPPTERLQQEVFPRIMAPMLAAGLPDRQASGAAGALAGLILGWVIYEQRPETREFVQAFHDPEQAFNYALDALVRGVEVKAAENRTEAGQDAESS